MSPDYEITRTFSVTSWSAPPTVCTKLYVVMQLMVYFWTCKAVVASLNKGSTSVVDPTTEIESHVANTEVLSTCG